MSWKDVELINSSILEKYLKEIKDKYNTRNHPISLLIVA